MAIGRVLVAIPQVVSGEGADLFVNTWHFQTRAPTSFIDAADEFIDELAAFYALIQGDMSEQVVGSPATAKAYNLADPMPRSPQVETGFAIDPVSTGALPTECSLCLSYRAEYASGAPKGRRRGRIYLGGFINALSTVEGDGTVSSSVMDDIVAAAVGLLTASDASTGFQWVVYSPTDGIARSVVGGWVDDAWDTQRRRGADMTTREEFGDGH